MKNYLNIIYQITDKFHVLAMNNNLTINIQNSKNLLVQLRNFTLSIELRNFTLSIEQWNEQISNLEILQYNKKGGGLYCKKKTKND